MIRLCCSGCHQKVSPKEEVTLDMMNTITHQHCEQTGLPIKDNGIFQDITHKYDFFKKLITH